MTSEPDTRSSTGSLRAKGLSLAYGSKADQTQVLRDVTLDLQPGTITGLAGESGSGKSTLALALMGYRPGGQRLLAGTVDLDGARLSDASVRRLRTLWGSRLAYMPQDTSTSLNPALTIGSQFGETLRRHRSIGQREALRTATEWLGRVELPDPAMALRRYPHQFSGGQQQRIALALALCLEPGVIILDEPTTGLDVVVQAQVNRLIIELARETHSAALYVSHNLALLATVCDDLAIMYAGELVEHGPVDELYRRPRHPYTSALISAVPTLSATAPPRGIPGSARTSVAHDECGFLARCPLRTEACRTLIPLVEVGTGHLARCVRPADVPPPGGALTAAPESVAATGRTEVVAGTLLSVTDLNCLFRRGRRQEPLRAVDRVSVSVAAGRTLGIAGESGSGKSTLLKAIAGLIRPDQGTISFHGNPLPALANRRSLQMRKAIGIVFQNPDATLNPRHTVQQSLERPLRLFQPQLQSDQRRAALADMCDKVRLSPSLLARYPRDLSGGQRQRVAIARSLLADPEVLLCDEVTSALDVSVQASIIELLIDLRDAHDLALVFVTHDLGVLRAIADDAVIMQNGQVKETGPVATLLRHPEDPYTQRLIAAVPDPDRAGSDNATRDDPVADNPDPDKHPADERP